MQISARGRWCFRFLIASMWFIIRLILEKHNINNTTYKDILWCSWEAECHKHPHLENLENSVPPRQHSDLICNRVWPTWYYCAFTASLPSRSSPCWESSWKNIGSKRSFIFNTMWNYIMQVSISENNNILGRNKDLAEKFTVLINIKHM